MSSHRSTATWPGHPVTAGPIANFPFSYRTAIQNVAAEDLACAAILAFFAIQGAIPFIAPNQALEATNTAASGLTVVGGILSQIVVNGAIAFLLVRYARTIFHWISAMQWAAPLALLAVTSVFWSQFPSITARRSVEFVLAGFFGLYFAVRFPLRRQLSIIWMIMIALAIGTAIMVICFPRLGLEASAGHQGDWQGVFTQKNACGRMMVLATAALLSDWRWTFARCTSLALFFFVLIMSGSRGAWLVEAAIFALYVVLRIADHFDSRSRVVLALTVVLAAVAGICAVVYYLPTLTALLGRDATLSGRTEIWKHVWHYILEKPLFGWGYAGFWRGIQGESFNVTAAVHFVVLHAHNGFLEIWLELGIVGLALFTLSYLRAWRKLWPILRSGDIHRVMWMVFVLALIGFYGLDENTLLIPLGLFWTLYVATLANIELLVTANAQKSRPASSTL